MVDSGDQVVFVLQVALALGPLAVYFLGLGLVNSQAKPVLASARADFILLTTAFAPVICWPTIALVQQGRLGMAAAVVAAVAGLFWYLVPTRTGGWVIYNISPEAVAEVIRRTCRRHGWTFAGHPERDEDCTVEPLGLRLTAHSMPWLRNVTIQLARPLTGLALDPAVARQFASALAGELGRESMLPSPTGASLVVLGAGLLGMPMWYLFRNMDAIVDVVRRILPA